MRIKLPPLHDESKIGESFGVDVFAQVPLQFLLRLELKVPLRAGININNIHIPIILLPIRPPNDEDLPIAQRHRVAGPRLRLALRILELIALRPAASRRVENEQVVEAEGVRARTAEQVEFLLHVAEGHAGARRGVGFRRRQLAPGERVEVEHVEVVEALRTVPAAEDVEGRTED